MRTTMRTTNDNQSISSMRTVSIFGLSPIKDLSIDRREAEDDHIAHDRSSAHDRSLAIRRARRELRKYSREIALAEGLVNEALRERSLNLYRALLAGTREFRLAA